MSGYGEDDSALHTETCFCHRSLADIKEFVTVVCYYNCKVCNFSCTSVGDIRSHIVDSHFHKTSGADGVVFSTEPKANSRAVTNDNGVTLTLNPDLAPVSVSNEASAGEAVGLMSKEFSTISQSGYDFLSSTVVTHSSDPSSLQPLQSTIAGHPLQLFVNNQELQLNVSNYFSGDSLPEVSASPASVQVGLCAETSHGSSLVPPADLVKASGQVAGQSGMGLAVEASEQMSEMYMCDSCGTVYSGIGIVQHMSQVHGIRLDSVNVSGSQTAPNVTSDQHMPTRTTEITMPPNTTSIGTQAQLAKKPGRKRKVITDVTTSAVAEEQNNKRAVNSAEKDSAAAVAVKTLGIERSTTTAGGTGLSKRRIHPPRALVEDYQILRLRQSKPRTRSSTSAAPKLLCSFVGCEATFRQQQAVDYHVKCHADGGTFCCPECRSSFADWSSTLPHLWTVHDIDHYAYQCGRCKFRADHFVAVTEHSLAEHGDRKPVQPFLCSVCGQTFRKANLRNQHEKSHRSRALHSRSVTQSELTAFRRCVCDVCKRTFANKKSLNKHIEIVHKKIKPFSCSVCGYLAARKAMLQLHERIHSGEKPFKCDVCSYSASDHNSLRRHRMRHTGQKPYHCAFCSYTAIQAVSLKMHMRTRHPTAATATSSADPVPRATMVYSCHACRYQTVNRRSWVDHVEDHHRSSSGSTPATSSDQLFVIQEQTGGQLLLAPLLQSTVSTSRTSSHSHNTVSASSVGVHDQANSTTSEHGGLRQILTAMSEHQHSSSTVIQSPPVTM